MKNLLFALLPLLMATSCSQDSCQEYSRFTCKQLEQKPFNVYYYDTDKRDGQSREVYVGQAIGLQQCASAAWDLAGAKAYERVGDWSYICCLQTDSSTCAEKHR